MITNARYEAINISRDGIVKVFALEHTVEPLKEDPPRKGHCIKYLSTMDKTKSPNLSLPINIMQLEPLKRGQPL